MHDLKLIVFFGFFLLCIVVAIRRTIRKMKFCEILKRRHGEIYRRLGKPKASDTGLQWRFNRYIDKRQYAMLNDPELTRLGDSIRTNGIFILLIVALVIGAMIVWTHMGTG